MIWFLWSEVLILSRHQQVKARFSGLCGYAELSQASPKYTIHGLKCILSMVEIVDQQRCLYTLSMVGSVLH